ncbi:hypothetical protein FYM84_12645 [Pseudomonas sp. CAH-1]|nr:hypothetical protein [Pseudomonas sp. CAH-1]
MQWGRFAPPRGHARCHRLSVILVGASVPAKGREAAPFSSGLETLTCASSTGRTRRWSWSA